MNQGRHESEEGKRGGWVFIEDDCGEKKKKNKGE